MLGFIVAIIISWYFFYNMDNNSYIKNVIIYSSSNLGVSILNSLISKTEIHIISSVIGSIIVGLIVVKIMEFTRARTSSLAIFILFTELCEVLFLFCFSFLYHIMFS